MFCHYWTFITEFENEESTQQRLAMCIAFTEPIRLERKRVCEDRQSRLRDQRFKCCEWSHLMAKVAYATSWRLPWSLRVEKIGWFARVCTTMNTNTVTMYGVGAMIPIHFESWKFVLTLFEENFYKLESLIWGILKL